MGRSSTYRARATLGATEHVHAREGGRHMANLLTNAQWKPPEIGPKTWSNSRDRRVFVFAVIERSRISKSTLPIGCVLEYDSHVDHSIIENRKLDCNLWRIPCCWKLVGDRRIEVKFAAVTVSPLVLSRTRPYERLCVCFRFSEDPLTCT